MDIFHYVHNLEVLKNSPEDFIILSTIKWILEVLYSVIESVRTMRSQIRIVGVFAACREKYQ